MNEWIPIVQDGFQIASYYLIVISMFVIGKVFIIPIINYVKEIKVAKIRANNPEPQQIITYLLEPEKIERESLFATIKQKWRNRKDKDGLG